MRRLLFLLALASPLPAVGQGQAGTAELLRARVDGALRQASAGDYGAATDALLGVLDWCEAPGNAEAFVHDCRTLANYSLGYVHQVQARATDASDLLRQAITYYDAVLAEDPDDADAIYNRALAVKALAEPGAEAWYREAAERDPARAGTYMGFLGDYYAGNEAWPEAIEAYRDALAADPGAEGARAGLVTAMRSSGEAGLDSLLAFGDAWRFDAAASARDAYGAVLEEVMAEPVPPEGEPRADEAIVQLVMLRERIGEPPFMASRSDLPGLVTWRPTLQLDAFLRSAVPDSAPWWTRSGERRQALATAALRRGISAGAEDRVDLAERLWLAGLDVAIPESAVAVDLQRELALLYTRDRRADPDGTKFRILEDRMFVEKAGVLASGDLEAAQRFHSTLGLIYVERGQWRPDIPARNAVDQLQWAVQAAEARERTEGFHQALPGIRSARVLALDSAEFGAAAAAAALDAVRAWLDVDELDAAVEAAATARRLGADAETTTRLEALIALRLAIAATSPACAANPESATLATGPEDFLFRQSFKMLADCADHAQRAREYRLRAFQLTQTEGFTLIGARDVRRLEAIAADLLRPVGLPVEHRLDGSGGPATGIAVSLPTETVPLWYVPPADALTGLRVLAILGPDRRDDIAVDAGVVTVPGDVPDDLVRRISSLPGVERVQRAVGAGPGARADSGTTR